MDLAESAYMENITARFSRGMSAFGVPLPVRLDQWAERHFYLSAESSYVEQTWRAWPFQRAIMACMSHDDIREVNLMKSARVGYTKMILACIGYMAHHRRRNQALWQPTDDDRDEFVKTELDPMLRDVPVMQDVFPAYMARHKDNTLQQKKFLGSMLHLKGGKAAKNYRRMSVDVAYMDEIDAFDRDVEKEGDPVMLAYKRIEGATFGKLICGTTPKLKGFSHIEDRVLIADERFRYVVPCPHCGEFHPLSWGGKDEPHGFKWQKDADGNPLPDSVQHLCVSCGGFMSQGDYLASWERGFYRSENGVALTIENDGCVFRAAAGGSIKPPQHVAFVDIWTAYSPSVSWPKLVREFQSAFSAAQTGDDSKLKSFWNTTLARTWEGDIEKTDAEELQARAEPFPLRVVPRGALLLLAGVDTQDNRLEATVWGIGRGVERWTVEHKVFFGNPAEDDVWQDLEEYLFETTFPHVTGSTLRIHASAIDSGGHNTQAVYDFVYRHRGRRVYAIKGRSGAEKHIKDGAGQVDLDHRGRRKKRGLILWHVGTNHAKDLLFSMLEISRPGPGFVHLSQDLPIEWFRQLAGEARATQRTAAGQYSRWAPLRKRVEALDCAVYELWLEFHLDLHRKGAKWWDALETKVCPVVSDMFDTNSPNPDTPDPAQHDALQPEPPASKRKRPKNFATRW